MSSAKPTDGLVSYAISIGNARLEDKYQVLRIEVTKQVNRISHALVEIRDGCVAKGAFSASDSAKFNPGASVAISMGYQNKVEPVFTGIITKQHLAINQQNTSVLRLECKNPAIKMTQGRNNACYFELTDSKIIEKITAKYSLPTKAEATKFAHTQMVQYYASDWDFILTRAQANGQLVFTEDGGLQINKPQGGEAAASLVYGKNILGFDAEVDSDEQYPQISSFSWQPDEQKLLEVKAKTPSQTQEGNPSEKLASDLKTKPLILQHGATLAKEDMQAWADAYWQNSTMSSVSGNVSTQGIAALKPGDIIELDGLAKHFNGKVWVKSVHQEMLGGNWVSHIGLGLGSAWFGHKPDVHTPLNQGLLPAVKGLQIGLVTEIDPEKTYKVRVKLPLISEDTKGVWARLGSNYAGKEYGCLFYPEVGDEVVLGFLDNDPRSPIILSALNSVKQPPSAEGKTAKPQKYLITKNKLKLCFDDEKKVIHLETPGGCQFDLSDEKKSILIKDPNGNECKMSDAGISLSSSKDILIKSTGGDLTLEGANVNITATTGDCVASGVNIDLSANAQLKAAGTAGVELSASGNTIIKGTMVMIN